MLENKTTITIINGFLGSGKTTFLEHYMRSILKNDEKVALIVNEFGDFDVDGRILNQNDIKISMTQGCVCCDLQSDLVAQIYQLAKQHVDRIIIEASGVANPIDILMACQDIMLEGLIEYPETICILDSIRFLERDTLTTQTQQLMEDQIKASQHVYINKVDQLKDMIQQQNLIDEVKRISPYCAISTTTYGVVQNTVTQGALEQQKSQIFNDHHHTHAHYQSLKYVFNNPIDQEAFLKFLLNLPDDILRLKGFVEFRNSPNQTILVQMANHIPLFDVIDETNMPNTIVIIGEQLDTTRLRNQLDMLQFS
ncbi:CobW family GTP-binding protein [Staphylococcus canis]|uniref:GTP-binding protein n=1 Tax=Staphylococcus canis TaxID=2724942 RepID=A0ABS0T5R8_9STAP|nr:GTP-binding protein [Staphylococcus canis]MBI5974007.1 GTP-binding protein [Staphylococcus canis]